MTNKRQMRVNQDLEIQKFDTSTGFDPKREMRNGIFGFGGDVSKVDRSSYDNFDDMIQNLRQMDKNLKNFKVGSKTSFRR